MRKCPFCKIKVNNSPHIYHCKDRTSDNRKEIKFLYIKFNFPEISRKSVLINYYSNKNYSLPDIKSEFNIDFKSVIFLLDYFNIERRNISTSSRLISVDKYKKTCIDKYGVDNVSKVDSIKNLKKETFIKNYGVDNIFKDESFKKWILDNNFAWNRLSDEENSERVKKQTKSIKKYWSNLTDEQKSKLHQYNGSSKLETKISEVLNLLSISYSTQFPLKGKIFDFKIENTNILIEVNGDYWHCNPNKYNEDDIVKFNGGRNKVSDIWKKDQEKKYKAENLGFKVIYIWEDEIKKSNDLAKLVLSKIYS
jgi:G:T-mismatch repair DNA endonuclease (very short patch repair protein)